MWGCFYQRRYQSFIVQVRGFQRGIPIVVHLQFGIVLETNFYVEHRENRHDVSARIHCRVQKLLVNQISSDVRYNRVELRYFVTTTDHASISPGSSVSTRDEFPNFYLFLEVIARQKFRLRQKKKEHPPLQVKLYAQ